MFNRYEYTRACLRTVADLTYPSKETIVVDNGSSDSTPSQLPREFPWARVLRSETNLGYAGGCNLGMRASQGTFVLVMNNDTWIVDRDLVGVLVDALRSHPRMAAVGPRIVDYDEPSRVLFDGENDAYGFLEISGVAVMLRREALEEVGLFDESFFAYYEDRDLFARLRRAGWSLLHVPGARLAHKGSVTAVPGSGFYYHWHNRNLVVFLRRHSNVRDLLLRVLPHWSRIAAWTVRSLVSRRDWEGLRLWFLGFWEGIRASLADQPDAGPRLSALGS